MVAAPQMLHRHHLRVALASDGFRRLFAVRLLAQFADGVFQASLAGAVLFNPERQAHAADVAAGFAVLLLPYSLIGPFAGVLLDRWWRQRVLVLSNVLRAGAVVVIAAEIAGGLHGEPFYASALVVLSISRFFLSALSAALPHVVGRDELVTANALSTTFGAIATTVGGAAAIGVRALIGSDDSAYAAVALAAIVPYAAAALVGTKFAKTVLGPDDVERDNRETLAEVAHGLVAGARHLRTRRPAYFALLMITVHRVCYGLFAVCSVLPTRTTKGEVEKSTLSTSAVRNSVPKRSDCSRNFAMRSGPMIPSGKPGKFSTSVVSMSWPPACRPSIMSGERFARAV